MLWRDAPFSAGPVASRHPSTFLNPGAKESQGQEWQENTFLAGKLPSFAWMCPEELLFHQVR